MKKTILLLTILVFLIACERQQREVGAAREVIGSPDWSVETNASQVMTESHVVSVAPRGPDSGPDGEKLFAKNCVACHQVNGQGVPGAFPPLDGSSYVAGDPSRVAAIVVYGLMGPITVKGTVYNSVMAPLGGAMNDEEIAAVITYVRSAWSNKAESVNASVVAEVRSKWGTRGLFNITELGEDK